MPSNQKAMTLMEIIVCMAIISMLAAVVIPCYYNYVQQGQAKAAQNNLIAIYSAQQNYNLNNNAWCISNASPPQQCDVLNGSATSIDTVLNLNITDSAFSYHCTKGNAGANGFSCAATSNANAQFTFTVDNNPLILPGATGCATGTENGCNPVCNQPNNTNLCSI